MQTLGHSTTETTADDLSPGGLHLLCVRVVGAMPRAPVGVGHFVRFDPRDIDEVLKSSRIEERPT